jgi:NTE family protein
MGVWKKENLPPRIGIGRPETGLVLPGGGARAAYQVGVLKAIARLLPPGSPCPFPVITGTSAGAINAVALACYADRFRAGVRILESVWSDFTTDQVYRTDVPAMLRASLHWVATVCLGGLGRYNPRSLFDNRPLRALLTERIPVDRIQRNIESGVLHAVSVTVSSYRSGRSVSFFQAGPAMLPWRRARREGRATRLGVCHMMASAAVPLVFPAEGVDGEFFGDGALRQMLPLSPAVHLGADRLLVIGVRGEPIGTHMEANRHDRRPTLGHVTGYLLDTLFMDGLYSDLERVTRINLLLESLGASDRTTLPTGLRRLETLVVLPGSDIRALATAHAAEMPLAVRMLLRGLGAHGAGGGQLMSYLLFERGFARALIELGFRDAMAHKEQVLALLRGDPMPAIEAPRSVAEDLSGQEQGAQSQEGPESHHIGHGG